MIVFKFLIFVLIISIRLKPISSQRFEDLSKLVKDVIENERVPSILWAKTCWKKSNDIDFMSTIPFPVHIAKSNASINLVIDENTNKQWFFIDMNCENQTDFLLNIEDKYFAHPYRWIIAGLNYDLTHQLAILPGSNIILANQNTNFSQYVLKQAYKISKEASIIFEDFGLWSREKGLMDLRSTKILSRRRRNLQGHVFRATTVFMEKGSENNTNLDDYNTNNMDTISKMSLEISTHWVASVNATMVIDVQRSWGNIDPKTGRFPGMIGQFQKNEADIAATSLFMIEERVPYVEYLSVVLRTEFAFLLRSPPLSYVSNIYYLPFTGIVWICSILLVVLCTLTIVLTLKCHLSTDEQMKTMTVADYVLFAIDSACQMGSEYLTKVLSTRISMFVLFIALLFLYCSYTASIVALLQSTTKSIRTISDLQNPAIEVGVRDTPYNRHYFKIENEPTRKLLYETKIAPTDAFMNMTQGVSRLRKGMFAFHSETNPAFREIERTFFENEKCGIVQIKFFSMADTWCIIQKRSPYKEILKVNLLKIREHGIQSRERARIYRIRPKCASDGKSFGSVRLNDCYTVVLIFIYGLFASILIFCMEKLFGTNMLRNYTKKFKQIMIRSKAD